MRGSNSSCHVTYVEAGRTCREYPLIIKGGASWLTCSYHYPVLHLPLGQDTSTENNVPRAY